MIDMGTIRNKGLALAGIGVLALAGCSGGGESAEEASSSAAAESDRTEVGGLTPRIVLAHDKGVTTIDSEDGEVLDTTEVKGYARLNAAGDGRHVMVSTSQGFQAYDTGLIAQAHGDHYHYYEQSLALTDITVKAPEPGHVVPHDGHTALFSDGTGEITIFETDALADGELGTPTEVKADAPHHGVAVPLQDDAVLLTQGTEDERHTVQVQDASGKVTAETTDCPGVHGEAGAQPTASGGDVVSLGCENGPVVYRDGAFHKVSVPEAYQRSGNQKGSPVSPIVLTDYKVEEDPAGGTEHPTRIGLLDTSNDTMRTVDLGSPYWFRSLDRGENGEALVITGDGELNILDPVSGAVTHEVPVVQPWTEPEEWQEPGPMMAVADGTAFVVDPEAKKLVLVDIASGEKYRELDLDVVPHEIQVTSGDASGSVKVGGGAASDAGGEHADHQGEGHEDHDHEGHDHGSSDGGH